METTITSEQQGVLSCHLVRTGCEWGRVIIDPVNKLVMCYSPMGNYNFAWYGAGGEFIDFLASLHYDYAMSKFLGAEKELDVPGSVENMLCHIREYRYDGYYTAEEARQMWDAVKEAAEWRADEFADRISQSAFSSRRADWYEWLCYHHGHQAKHFWNLIWRPLMASLTAPPVAA